MSKFDFIYQRHSVRKFKDIDIPNEEIRQLIEAATYAPSGNNVQNWHFVVIKNKAIIQQMVQIIEEKNKEFSEYTSDEDKKQRFRRYVKYHTAFKNAPVVILVYSGPYPVTGEELLKEKDPSLEQLLEFRRPSPGIQNIGAAMENLLLVAAAKGYGTCWMTGPSYARKELENLIKLDKEGYFLTAMTPLGIPEELDVKRPPRKPVEEVLTIIE